MLNETFESERMNQLAAEFYILRSEESLSFSKIQSYLSQKSGRSFNRILLNEIFRQINCDENSIITLNEFVTAFYKTEVYFKSSIEDIKKEISEFKKNITDIKRELIESRGFESKPLLLIIVHEAKKLQRIGLQSNKFPFIKILYKDLVFATKPIPNPTNPQ